MLRQARAGEGQVSYLCSIQAQSNVLLFSFYNSITCSSIICNKVTNPVTYHLMITNIHMFLDFFLVVINMNLPRLILILSKIRSPAPAKSCATASDMSASYHEIFDSQMPPETARAALIRHVSNSHPYPLSSLVLAFRIMLLREIQ